MYLKTLVDAKLFKWKSVEINTNTALSHLFISNSSHTNWLAFKVYKGLAYFITCMSVPESLFKCFVNEID